MKTIKTIFLFVITFVFTNAAAHADETILFHGFGTEPFWSLDVTETKVKFYGLDIDTMYFDYKNIKHAVGFTKEYYYEFSLLNNNQAAGVLIISKLSNCNCTDGMSDYNYEFECILILDKYTYRGCAVRRK